MLQNLNLSKKILLAKYLNKGLGTLAYSKFSDLLSVYGLGTRKQQSLYLTLPERNELKKLFELKIGEIEFFALYDNSLNRIDIKRHSVSDKVSSQSVTINDVRMFTLDSVFNVNDTTTPLLSNANLIMQYEDITSIEHDVIVICENLTPFIQLQKYQDLLPSELTNALFIYRGNGSSVSGVYKLCKRVTSTVYVMADLDLSGLVITNTIPNARYALYPMIEALSDANALLHQENLWQDQQQFFNAAKG